MLAGLMIFTLAVLLLVYWFRYACTLALSEKKELACIARVAAVNGLSFLAVQKKLKTGDATLDVLCESLDRDYRVLRYLLRYAAGRRLRSLEQNKADAIERLVAMIREALIEPKVRRKTKPTRASRERRLETKTRTARTKRLRGRQRIDD